MNKDLADQDPSETPCTWCGDPARRCGYEEYAAPCMSEQILALREEPLAKAYERRALAAEEALRKLPHEWNTIAVPEQNRLRIRAEALEEAARMFEKLRAPFQPDQTTGVFNATLDGCIAAIRALKDKVHD